MWARNVLGRGGGGGDLVVRQTKFLLVELAAAVPLPSDHMSGRSVYAIAVSGMGKGFV